ncbi:MAG: hypothetical protein HY675_15835 [Chloroflexi bacterium]|nr:hypothetical protein [Chloroflexota bacterium]
MRFWHLTREQVAAILNNPDDVTASRKGRQNSWKKTGKDWTRVTHVREAATTTVVTVTVTPRGPERKP